MYEHRKRKKYLRLRHHAHARAGCGRPGKAGDCIKCGKCEQACPQHLPIREYPEQAAAKFEGGSSFPTRAK